MTESTSNKGPARDTIFAELQQKLLADGIGSSMPVTLPASWARVQATPPAEPAMPTHAILSWPLPYGMLRCLPTYVQTTDERSHTVSWQCVQHWPGGSIKHALGTTVVAGSPAAINLADNTPFQMPGASASARFDGSAPSWRLPKLTELVWQIRVAMRGGAEYSRKVDLSHDGGDERFAKLVWGVPSSADAGPGNVERSFPWTDHVKTIQWKTWLYANVGFGADVEFPPIGATFRVQWWHTGLLHTEVTLDAPYSGTYEHLKTSPAAAPVVDDGVLMVGDQARLTGSFEFPVGRRAVLRSWHHSPDEYVHLPDPETLTRAGLCFPASARPKSISSSIFPTGKDLSNPRYRNPRGLPAHVISSHAASLKAGDPFVPNTLYGFPGHTYPQYEDQAGTGDRPDIGLFPEWYNRAILAPGSEWAVALVCSETNGGAAFPVFTMPDTHRYGIPDYLVSEGARPDWKGGSARHTVPTPSQLSKHQMWSKRAVLNEQHAPAVGLGWMLWGDVHSLEMLNAYAAKAASYKHRDRFDLQNVPYRGAAWTLRTITLAATWGPDEWRALREPYHALLGEHLRRTHHAVDQWQSPINVPPGKRHWSGRKDFDKHGQVSLWQMAWYVAALRWAAEQFVGDPHASEMAELFDRLSVVFTEPGFHLTVLDYSVAGNRLEPVPASWYLEDIGIDRQDVEMPGPVRSVPDLANATHSELAHRDADHEGDDVTPRWAFYAMRWLQPLLQEMGVASDIVQAAFDAPENQGGRVHFVPRSAEWVDLFRALPVLEGTPDPSDGETPPPDGSGG